MIMAEQQPTQLKQHVVSKHITRSVASEDSSTNSLLFAYSNISPAAKILSFIPIWLLKLIYRLEDKGKIRDRELKILCLGLGRTGTDSLRNALIDLGYDDVAHAWHFLTEQNIQDLIQIERLNRAAFGPFPDRSFLNKEQFDRVLGSCRAVSDQPMVAQATQLLRLYPDAKVILNRRPDVDAWHRSQAATIDKVNADWPSWTRQWFDADLFWTGRMMYWYRCQYRCNFEKYGKEYYHQHYAAVEAELRAQGREWLDWKVQDGWEPLCGFLGENVPAQEFPHENATGGWDKRRMEVHGKRMARADFRRNVAAVVVLASAVVGVWIAML